MTPKKPKVGDACLMHGRMMSVVEIEDLDGHEHQSVTVTEGDTDETRARAVALREQVKQRIHALRAEQRECRKGDEDRHAELAAEITKLDRFCPSRVAFQVGIRSDRLSWWPERECWTSDGRILSDAQRERFRVKMGLGKVRPEQHRAAYDYLETTGLLDDPEHADVEAALSGEEG